MLPPFAQTDIIIPFSRSTNAACLADSSRLGVLWDLFFDEKD